MMVMFREGQRVKIQKCDDERAKGKSGEVIKINDDGSALVRIRGDSKFVTGVTVWPEDCRPL